MEEEKLGVVIEFLDCSFPFWDPHSAKRAPDFSSTALGIGLLYKFR